MKKARLTIDEVGRLATILNKGCGKCKNCRAGSYSKCKSNKRNLGAIEYNPIRSQNNMIGYSNTFRETPTLNTEIARESLKLLENQNNGLVPRLSYNPLSNQPLLLSQQPIESPPRLQPIQTPQINIKDIYGDIDGRIRTALNPMITQYNADQEKIFSRFDSLIKDNAGNQSNTVSSDGFKSQENEMVQPTTNSYSQDNYIQGDINQNLDNAFQNVEEIPPAVEAEQPEPEQPMILRTVKKKHLPVIQQIAFKRYRDDTGRKKGDIPKADKLKYIQEVKNDYIYGKINL